MQLFSRMIRIVTSRFDHVYALVETRSSSSSARTLSAIRVSHTHMLAVHIAVLCSGARDAVNIGALLTSSALYSYFFHTAFTFCILCSLILHTNKHLLCVDIRMFDMFRWSIA